MKKVVSLILIALLIIPCVSGSAEGFSLRNGVCFGDSAEEIRSKETLEISEDESRNAPSGEILWTVEGNVEGLEDAQVYYYCDNETGLQETLWTPSPSDDPHAYDDDYSMLVDQFTALYGEPLGYTDGKYHDVIGTTIQGTLDWIDLYAQTIPNSVGEITDYAEWYLPYDENSHIKIEIVKFYCGPQGSETYGVEVGFTHSPDMPAAAQNDAFVPEKLTATYNSFLPVAFSSLIGESEYSALVKEMVDFAEVSLVETGDTYVAYGNANSSILFFFSSNDVSSAASDFRFNIGLRDSNPLRNLPAYAFALAYSSLDTSCDAYDFNYWVHSATDGDTYSSDSFSASYSMEPHQHIHLDFESLS